MTQFHTMARGQGPPIAAVTVLTVASLVAAAGAPNPPRRLVWQGTITTVAGTTGTFRARTHFHDGRDMDTTYRGRFRCRGTGCPAHHGAIEVVPFDFPPQRLIDEVIFGAGHPDLNCALVATTRPPNFGVEGTYACYTVVPPDKPPAHLFSEGTLILTLVRESN